MGLYELPTEVLILALSLLDGPSLLRASQVNHKFHAVVGTASALRYIVELYRDGLVDTGRSRLSCAEKLELVHRRRFAWRTLDWQHCHFSSCTGRCSAYELVSGVFTKNYRSQLSFLPLPFRSEDVPVDPSSLEHQRQIPYSPSDLAIDPSQDLIVFLRLVENYAPRIVLHMGSLSTGKRHPEAKEHDLFYTVPIELSSRPSPISNVFMQLAHDILYLFVSSGARKNHLIAWNWKTGQCLFDIDSTWVQPEEQRRPREPILTFPNSDFALVDPHTFILSDRRGSGGLSICRAPSSPGDPTYITTLLLPPLMNGVHILELSTHSNALMANSPGSLPTEGFQTDRPFTTDPDARIHLIHITYGTASRGGAYKVLLAVHQRVFSSYAKMSDSGIKPVSSSYDWEQWGPQNSRVIAAGQYGVPSFPWLRYIHGTKLVLPSPTRNPTFTNVVVFDFSRNASSSEGSHHTHNSHPTMTLPIDSLPVESSEPFINHSPTHIPSNIVFREPVITSLPYYVVSRKVGYSLQTLLIDEDRIIGVKDTPHPASRDPMAGLHLFAI